ncbi:MAG: hypothetical protein JXR82_15185 [Marinifilaceae bacterium]|nr:hypothetical protein [Marinifilaceae bacterium]
MSTNDEIKRQQELERQRQEQIRQERERRNRREEELRRIREIQINEKQRNDNIVKGKPTGSRPGKDD